MAVKHPRRRCPRATFTHFSATTALVHITASFDQFGDFFAQFLIGFTLEIVCFVLGQNVFDFLVAVGRSQEGTPLNLPRMSPATEQLLATAAQLSTSADHHYLGVEHLFLELIAIDPASGRSESIDLDAIEGGAEPLGWCRGLHLHGDTAFVGFTRIRATRWRSHLAWVRGRLGNKPVATRLPTRVVAYDLARRVRIGSWVVEDVGIDALFGILPRS